MKKALSLLLALVMITSLSIAALPASAEGENTVISAVISQPLENATTLTGKGVSKLTFTFDPTMSERGFGAAWGVGIVGEDGEVARWYNMDSDESIILDGAEVNGSWGASPFDVWEVVGENMTGNFIWQIPEADIAAAGYETMYDIACAGKLKVFFGEYDASHEVDGLITCTGSAVFAATGTVNGKDALICDVVADGYVAPEPNPSNPNTGDTTVAAIAIAAIASMGVVLAAKKKRV